MGAWLGRVGAQPPHYRSAKHQADSRDLFSYRCISQFQLPQHHLDILGVDFIHIRVEDEKGELISVSKEMEGRVEYC